MASQGKTTYEVKLRYRVGLVLVQLSFDNIFFTICVHGGCGGATYGVCETSSDYVNMIQCTTTRPTLQFQVITNQWDFSGGKQFKRARSVTSHPFKTAVKPSQRARPCSTARYYCVSLHEDVISSLHLL